MAVFPDAEAWLAIRTAAENESSDESGRVFLAASILFWLGLAVVTDLAVSGCISWANLSPKT